MQKLSSLLMAIVYLFTISPVSLIAQEKNAQNETTYNFIKSLNSSKEEAISNEAIDISNPLQTQNPIELSTSKTIGKEGGELSLGLTKIQIPSGALEKDTQITIQYLEDVEELSEDIKNETLGASGFRFLPHGTKFKKNVHVTLPYSPSLNNSPSQLKNLSTWFYDTENSKWEKLNRVAIDTKNCLLTSETNHFTDMINATLALPENASPLEANLNSIKQLENANAMAGIVDLQGFMPTNTGDATFNFSIPLTGGRNGMVPQVAIVYSSDIDNSILGQGFELNYASAITTDTRKGLPLYDCNDTYLKDGQLLEKTDSNNKYDTYETRRKSSFEKIQAFKQEEGTYSSWLVIQKNGMKLYYGTSQESSLGRDEKSKFTWLLTKQIDTFGNTINYFYEKDENFYSYPTKITYTGNSFIQGESEIDKYNNLGLWSVNFYYDKQSRIDSKIDARGKYIQSIRWRLNEIKTCYKNYPIKSVEISYMDEVAPQEIYNASFKSYVKKISMNSFNAGSEEKVFDYAYEFNYQDLIKDSNNNYVYFSERQKFDNDGAISTSSSLSSSSSANGTAGLGYGTRVFDVAVSAGLTASTSKSTNWTNQLLIDIDGDNRPDRIVQGKNKLKIYHNNGEGFDDDYSVYYEFDNLEKEETKSSSTGWLVSTGPRLYSDFVKADTRLSKSKTDQSSTSNLECTFSDVNCDGLLDIVQTGKNYYLKNNGVGPNGKISFSKTYVQGKSIQSHKTVLTNEQAKKYEHSYYLETPFRVFKCPFDGTIKIEQTIQELSQNETKTLIYLENEQVHSDEVKVKKDQRLFFIQDFGIDSREKEIDWQITLHYTNANLFASLPAPFLFPQEKYYFSTQENEQYLKLKESHLYAQSIETIDDDPTDYFTLTLKDNWKDLICKDDIQILIDEKRIIPTFLTEELYVLLAEQIKTEVQNETDFLKYFGSVYKYDKALKIYILDEKTLSLKDEVTLKNAILIADCANKIAQDALKLYDSNQYIQSDFTGNDTISKSKLSTLRTNERSLGEMGSITNNGTTITLGKIYDEKISLLLNEQKIYFDNSKQKNDIKDFKVDENNNISFKIGYDSFDILYNLKNFSRRTENVFIDEYESLKYLDYFYPNENEIEAIKTSLLKQNSLLKEDELEKLAQEKAHTQAQEKFNKDFDFYELNENQTCYVLKDEWHDKKTLEDFIAEIDRTEINNDDDYEAAVYQKELEFNSYNKKNELLENVQEAIKLGRYDVISKQIEYKTSHAWNLSKGKENVCIDFTIIEDDEIKLIKIPYISTQTISTDIYTGKNYWNSKEDFSTKDFNSELVLKEFTETNEGEDQISNIKVNSCDLFYGGNKNWYYAIWIGNLQDNPFDVKKFETTLCASKDEFDKGKQNAESYNPEDADGSDITLSSWTLPCVYQNDVDDEITVGENTLIGNISCTTQTQYSYDEDDNLLEESKSIYSWPYITSSAIHASRNGGEAFYNLEGIEEFLGITTQNNSNEFSFPYLRKNSSQGTDDVLGLKNSFSLSIKETYDLAEKINDLDQAVNTATGSGSLDLGKSSNNSKSSMMQNFQDLNGDGIPDFIIKNSSCLYVYYGKKDSNGNVCYNDDAVALDPSINLNKTKTDINIYNATIGAGGGMTVLHTSSTSANSVQVAFNNSGNGSGGISYSKGSNLQTAGFFDFNGDGLLDYYDNGSIQLNMGGNFKSYENYNFANDASLVSTNISVGTTLPFSIGNFEGSSLQTSASVGASLGFSASINNSKCQLIDINGDGLLDIVKKENTTDEKAQVYFNTGNSFKEEVVEITIPTWNISSDDINNFTTTADGNIAKDVLSQTPVIGKLLSKSGILNKIDDSTIALNPFGAKLKDYANALSFSSTLSFNSSANLCGNAKTSFDIIIMGIYCGTINFAVQGSAGSNNGASQSGVSVTFSDIDGDGFVDQLLRIPGDALYYKRNLMGEGGVGKIKSIKSSTGKTWQIEYELEHSTPVMPRAKYVMKNVYISDGMEKIFGENGHKLKFEYSYENGYFDREEKDFYGFEKVTEYFFDNTKTVTTYFNDAYFSKGIVKSVESFDDDGNVYKITENTLLGDSSTNYALPKQTTEITKDIKTSNQISKTTIYTYDIENGAIGENFGNITKVQEFINEENAPYRTIFLKWNNDFSKNYLANLPLEIVVKDSSDNILVKKQGFYDENGALTLLKHFYEQDKSLNYSFNYNELGNLLSAKYPSGVTLSYEYDNKNTLPIKINKSAQNITHSSTIEYDEYGRNQKIRKTDINKNDFTYEYDEKGRITKIFSPYDTNKIPFVEYIYNTPDLLDENEKGVWYAITKNKIDFNGEDTIETIRVCDGFNRPILNAKTGIFFDSESKIDVLGWNVSGFSEYDNKGRIVKQYSNRFVEGDFDDLLKNIVYDFEEEYFVETQYDCLNRVIKKIYPAEKTEDRSIQTIDYEITDDLLLKTTVTDSNDNCTSQFVDAKSNITKIHKFAGETSTYQKATNEAFYEYDDLGRMIASIDAKSNRIEVTYDMLSRKIKLSSSDTGNQRWWYDEKGNLSKSQNGMLEEKNAQILYEYDDFGRLVKIDYPFSEDTVYEYENFSTKNNALGKVKKITDETGSTEYEYGKLGETTKEKRFINSLKSKRQIEAVTCYNSNYLGQLNYIIYPDGEKVSYSYDRAGNVKTVTGETPFNTFEYVKNIGYDEYGQKIFVEYDNGIETHYCYDKAKRYLKNVKTQIQKIGKLKLLQNICYDFDKEGNILSRTEELDDWSVSHQYTYDSLYQLIYARGDVSNNLPEIKAGLSRFNDTYTQEFSFDELNNMTKKVSFQKNFSKMSISSLEADLNYTLDYKYQDGFAHRLEQVGTRFFKYDAGGNLLREQDKPFTPNETVSFYDTITVDSDNQIYAQDYAWARNRSNSDESLSNVDYYYRDYSWNERNLLTKTTDSSCTTHYSYGVDGQRASKTSNLSETLYFNKFFTSNNHSKWTSNSRMTKHIFLGSSRIASKFAYVSKDYDFKDTNTSAEKSQLYFYHADHVGNTAVVTDYQGDVYERLEYTPYGEAWIDYNCGNDMYENPFRFTGKEHDEETGLHYFGARYLDSKYSRWLSADPALNDYVEGKSISGGLYSPVNLNLYHYSGNNPVNYVDPDGNEWVQRTVNDVTEVFYSRTVHTTQEAQKKFGKDAVVLEDGASVNGYNVHNPDASHKYGFVTDSTGNEVTDKKIDRQGNTDLFIATGDKDLDPATLHDNWFGTSYTGPDNPKRYVENEGDEPIMTYEPRNPSEKGSMEHDKAYHKSNVSGIKGALTCLEVYEADLELASFNIKNFASYESNLTDKVRSLLTATLFGILGSVKFIIYKLSGN